MQRAADLGVPCATIQAALDARALSALKGERKQAAALLNFDRRASFGPGSRKPLPAFEWRDELEAALYCSLLCSYTQGMAHLQAASREHGWRLDLADLAAIWCGGCIIRARVLHDIHAAYRRDPRLPSLLLDATIARELARRAPAWRRLVALAVQSGVPIPALSASLAYYDGYRTEVLVSAQCVQAQRDSFGAHGFMRLDRDGAFTADWGAPSEAA